MSDDPVEEIKRGKLEKLQQSGGASSPDEPVPIGGRAEFTELLDDQRIVLVDCHAEWCGPCQQLKPIVKQVAAETSATVAIVDIDEHRDLAAEWSVRSVPTLLMFVDGELTERLVGVQPYDRIAQLIETQAG